MAATNTIRLTLWYWNNYREFPKQTAPCCTANDHWKAIRHCTKWESSWRCVLSNNDRFINKASDRPITEPDASRQKQWADNERGRFRWRASGKSYDMMQLELPLTHFQYAYMTHFFANPLSVFLCKSLRFEDLSKEHLDALRNLPSFRQYASPETTGCKSLC